MKKTLKYLLALGSLLPVLNACKTETSEQQVVEDPLSQRAAFYIQPQRDLKKLGDTLHFQWEISDTSRRFDSVVVAILGKRQGLAPGLSFDWQSKEVGTMEFQLTGFEKGNAFTSSISFRIASDLVPQSYQYSIVETLPHNASSFTQGLEWANGILYEGTGLNGKSSVMEIDPETGQARQEVKLNSEFFGEGITVLDNQLYQITWKNRKGFIYSLPKLEKTKEFSYPTDGWGLTHWQNKLLMTDGGNVLYTLEPVNFSSIRKQEVWDHKNPIAELNELETVGDRIWANKYQTDTLVQIDPETGRVTGYADLSGLLKNENRNGDEDVLNGIAWHPEKKLFYVTGKNWSKMFAIRLTPKGKAL